MIEQKEIPTIAKTAIALAQSDYRKIINELALQTLEAMELSTKDGWTVTVDSGIAVREVPDKEEDAKDSKTPPKTEKEK